MGLLVYNTGSYPITLNGGRNSPTVQPCTTGSFTYYNITEAFRTNTKADWTNLENQRASSSLGYVWDGVVNYDASPLQIDVAIPTSVSSLYQIKSSTTGTVNADLTASFPLQIDGVQAVNLAGSHTLAIASASIPNTLLTYPFISASAGSGLNVNVGTVGLGDLLTISQATQGTPGTYNSVTVDAFGRVSAGTVQPYLGYVPSLSASYAGATDVSGNIIQVRSAQGPVIIESVTANIGTLFQIQSGSTILARFTDFDIQLSSSVNTVSGTYNFGSSTAPWKNITSITGSFQTVDTITIGQVLNIGNQLAGGILLGRSGAPVRPAASGSQILGGSTLPWQNVTGITGSYQVVDTPTTNQNLIIGTINAAGIVLGNGTVRPNTSGSQNFGLLVNPWANIFSITGSFQQVDTPNTNQNLNLGQNNATATTIGAGGGIKVNVISTSMYPNFSGSYALGLLTNPWSNVISITGSHQVVDTPNTNQTLQLGNVNAIKVIIGANPVSGVFVDGGSDKVHLQTSTVDRWLVHSGGGHFVPAASGTYDIGTLPSSGLGSLPVRNVVSISGSHQIVDTPNTNQDLLLGWNNSSNTRIASAGVSRLVIDSNGIVRPAVSGTQNFGTNSFPWLDVMSINVQTTSVDTITTNQNLNIGQTNAASIVLGIGTVRPGTSGSQTFGSVNFPWGQIIGITGSYQVVDTPTTNQNLQIGNQNANAVLIGKQGTTGYLELTLQRAYLRPVSNGITSYIGIDDITGSFLSYAGVQFKVNSVGAVLTQGAVTGQTPNTLIITGGAHLSSSATVEAVDIAFNLNRIVQFASGNIALQRAINIQAPTYAFTSGTQPTNTIAAAATVYITGAPIAGASASITNSYAFWVAGGVSRFDGDLWISAANLLRTNTIDTFSGGVLTFGSNNLTSIKPVGSGTIPFGNVSFPWSNIVSITGSFQTIDVPRVNQLLQIGNQNANAVLIGRGSVTILSASVGATTIVQSALTTVRNQPALKVVAGANTLMVSGTEINDIWFNIARTTQWQSGSIINQRAVYIDAPTYSFDGASTITNAATLAISNAPQVGSNATITNAYALWVQSGNSYLSGTVHANQFYSDTNFGLDTISIGGLNIGVTNANAIQIGNSTNTTTFPGTVTFNGIVNLVASTGSIYQVNNINVTQVAALSVQNVTAGNVGNTIQNSPGYELVGQVYVTGTSQTMKWLIQEEPTVFGNGGSYLDFFSSENGSVYTKRVRMDISGSVWVSSSGSFDTMGAGALKIGAQNATTIQIGNQKTLPITFVASGTNSSTDNQFAFYTKSDNGTVQTIRITGYIIRTEAGSNGFGQLGDTTTRWGTIYGNTFNGNTIDNDVGGTITLGGVSATSINISRTGQQTVISGTLKVLQAATLMTASIIEVDSLANSLGPGLTLQNTTAASLSVQIQNSPGIALIGQAENTILSSSQTSKWLIANTPISSGKISSSLSFYSSESGSATNLKFWFEGTAAFQGWRMHSNNLLGLVNDTTERAFVFNNNGGAAAAGNALLVLQDNGVDAVRIYCRASGTEYNVRSFTNNFGFWNANSDGFLLTLNTASLTLGGTTFASFQSNNTHQIGNGGNGNISLASTGVTIWSPSNNGTLQINDSAGSSLGYTSNNITFDSVGGHISGPVSASNGIFVTAPSGSHPIVVSGSSGSYQAQALFKDTNGNTHFGVDAGGLPSLGSNFWWQENWLWMWTNTNLTTSPVPNSGDTWVFSGGAGSLYTGMNGTFSTTSPLMNGVSITTGVTNGIRCAFESQAYTVDTSKLNNLYVVMEWSAGLTIIGANNVAYFGGLFNLDPTLNTHAKGYYFKKASSDTNWQAVTDDGTTTNTINTGVAPVASTFNRFRIEFYGSATIASLKTVKFYIDGSLVATSTTNVFAGQVGVIFAAQNTATATSQNMSIGPMLHMYNTVAAPLAP